MPRDPHATMSDTEDAHAAFRDRVEGYERNGHHEYASDRFIDDVCDTIRREKSQEILYEDWVVRRARILHDAQQLIFARFIARLRKLSVDANAYERLVIRFQFSPPEAPRLLSVALADVEPEAWHWLWAPYVPLGKITLLEGDPGLGKTFLALTIAAAVTKGFHLPDQQGKITHPHGEGADVVYITAEDGIADTLRPRAEDAGADLKRLHAVTGWTAGDGLHPFSFEQLPLLDTEIKRHTAKLVILDPLQAFLGAGVDMFRANEVRPLMWQVGEVAKANQCAVILIRHWTKAPGGKARYRGQGSIDFAAVARSIIMVGESPEDDHKRIMAHTKVSHGAPGRSIVFAVTDQGLQWCGTSEFSADELSDMQPNKRKHQLDTALNWLRDYLRDGPQLAESVMEDAKRSGIPERTLRRAKESLKVLSAKDFGKWYWRLPRFESWDRGDDDVPF